MGMGIPIHETDAQILGKLLHRATDRQNLADIGDGDEQPLMELIAELEETLREARHLANHVHFWDVDQRCTVCGADGRA